MINVFIANSQTRCRKLVRIRSLTIDSFQNAERIENIEGTSYLTEYQGPVDIQASVISSNLSENPIENTSIVRNETDFSNLEIEG